MTTKRTIMTMWYVIEHPTNRAVESHPTEAQAEQAAQWLTEHEARCARDRAAGLREALRADRPGRPYTYTVSRGL